MDLNECHSRRRQIMKAGKRILFRVRAYSFHKLRANSRHVQRIHPELWKRSPRIASMTMRSCVHTSLKNSSMEGLVWKQSGCQKDIYMKFAYTWRTTSSVKMPRWRSVKNRMWREQRGRSTINRRPSDRELSLTKSRQLWKWNWCCLLICSKVFWFSEIYSCKLRSFSCRELAERLVE